MQIERTALPRMSTVFMLFQVAKNRIFHSPKTVRISKTSCRISKVVDLGFSLKSIFKCAFYEPLNSNNLKNSRTLWNFYYSPVNVFVL